MNTLGSYLGAKHLGIPDDVAAAQAEADPAFESKPGQANVVDEDGTRGYRTNAPIWYGRQQYFERENGGAGGPRLIGGVATSPSQGLGAWKNSFAGTGAARTTLTGQPSWFSGAASIETGTTSSGSFALTLASDPAMAVGPGSGVLTYKGTYKVPVLSDATDTFIIAIGPNDNSNGTLVVDGVFIRYQYNVNGGRWQLVARDNSSEVTDDTGVTVSTDDFISVMVRVTGDTLAEGWVRVIKSGAGAYSDDGVWGAAHASISTGIPSGLAREFQAGPAILKTAGTTSRALWVGKQSVSWVAATGEQPGMVRYIDENGDSGWTHPQSCDDPIVHMAYHRGGWLPSASTDFGMVTSGTQPAIDAFAADNGGIGTSRLRTQSSASQYSGLVTACNIVLDADTDVQVFESVFTVPTLSTGAQKHKFVAGHFDDYVSAHTRGITVEIDSNADPQFQCVVMGPSGTTTVDSGITAVAGTYVAVRVIATPSSIAFYIRANGAAAYGSPVATITTNIPLGVDLMAGAVFRKSVGTTNTDAYIMHLLTFTRCTTNANANYGKIRVGLDDNSGTDPTEFSYWYNVPSPRTQPYALLSSAHLGLIGSSDFGTGAGGDASYSDLTHPNPFTTETGTTTTGHVALGPGGDVSGIVLSATSGLLYFDYTGLIEAVSDGTNTYFVRLGLPSHTYNAVTNGIYLTVDANAAANVQLVTVANGVATTTDTGVAWSALTWYRARIEASNNTEVRLWLAADDAAWPSTPTAVVTTNIPSGTSQAVKMCVTIKKSAGTTSRHLATFYATVGRDRYAA